MVKLKNKDNIWFTSDTHYSHKNICLGVSEWSEPERSCRNFLNLTEMNDEIVYQINRNVKEDDILFHLGDWSFGGIDKIWEFRKKINCKNIHLVLGNHDHHIKKNKPYRSKWIRYYNGPIDQWYEFNDNYSTKQECQKACNEESMSFYIPEDDSPII